MTDKELMQKEEYRARLIAVLDEQPRTVYELGNLKGDLWSAKQRGEMHPDSYKIACEVIDERIKKLQLKKNIV